jgi:hemolysin D
MFRAREDHHEFRPLLVEIEEEPQNPLGRVIFWIIILALLSFALWMSLGRIDVVVTARGRVIPAGEVKTIQPMTTGVVSTIRVKAGQLVAAGEVLMEIDPADTASELVSMQADLKQTELDILRIETLLAGSPFAPSPEKYDAELLRVQHRLYQSGRDQLRRQIQVKHEELAQLTEQQAGEQIAYEQAVYRRDISRQRLERLDPVRDLVSQDDLDQARTDVTTFDHQLATAQHKLTELASGREKILQQISLIEEENRHQLLTDLAQKRQEYLYLQAKIERTEFVNTRQQIRSPVRGHVSQLLVHTIGGVVTPAEKLAVVVPADSPQLIRARVLNKDVGYLSPGMEVAIKIDTFEFQKYGMLRGRLLQVAQDSIEDEQQGLVYEAYVEPLEATLLVDGARMPLATGMSVSAEIKVGKRRIIEFFIYPLIKYLDEGTSVR